MVVTLSKILAFVDLREMELLRVGRDDHTMAGPGTIRLQRRGLCPSQPRPRPGRQAVSWAA